MTQRIVAVLQNEFAKVPFDTTLKTPAKAVEIVDDALRASSRHLASYRVCNSSGMPTGRVSFYTTSGEPPPARHQLSDYANRQVFPLDDRCIGGVLAGGVHALATQTEKSEPPEPPATSSAKERAAGVVLVDDEGRVTLVEPAGEFGGYKHTFPKGRPHTDDLTLQDTALRELAEETGLTARLVACVGDFEGDVTVTRYYLGVPTGGTDTTSTETAAIKHVYASKAFELLNRQRDRDVLRRALELAAAASGWTWMLDGPSSAHDSRLIDSQPPYLQMTLSDAALQAIGDAEIAALGGTGVYADQFGGGQRRFWFMPKRPQSRDELYDHVAGIIARELGKNVLLSALWLYPESFTAAGQMHEYEIFMFHLIMRDDPTAEPHGEYDRISTAVIDQLADLSADHQPHASSERSGA